MNKVNTIGRRSFLRRTTGLAAGAMASGFAAKPPARPNILFLMTDEQRTDSLGCYGSPWAVSPNLDALAREGVVFRNALTPSPLCTPARCSLLSGLYPSETGVWSNHNKPTEALPYLTQVFADAGYRTASFGKQHHNTVNHAFQEQESIVLTDAVNYFNYAPKYPMERYDVVRYPGPKYKWIFGGRFPEPLENNAEFKVTSKVKQWLENASHDQPFLIQVSFNAPHTPVSVATPFDTAVPEDTIKLPPEAEAFPDYAPDSLCALREISRSDRFTPEQIRKLRRYYYGLTSFTDSRFGDLLRWMRERGLLENTIVAYVSDHGTHLGDFGMFQKQTFFNPAMNVPYFFWYPNKIATGRTLDTPVSTVSLMPTLIELAGLDMPELCRGRSLAEPLQKGVEPESKPVFSGHSLASFDLLPGKINLAVREGDWKLSIWQAPCMERRTLVNLADDPHERRNRINDPDCADVANRLTGYIEKHLAAGRTPNPEAC